MVLVRQEPCVVWQSSLQPRTGFIGAILEPTNVLIRDIWQTDFEQFLEHYEIPYTFRASPLPDYTLHFQEGDSKLLCRSFENYTRIIGLNLSHVLVDEIDTVSPAICDKAFPKILGRLRAGNVRQFAAASTPEGFSGYITHLVRIKLKKEVIGS